MSEGSESRGKESLVNIERLAQSRDWREKAETSRTSATQWTTAMRRVGVWRGGFRLSMSVAAPFVWRCLSGSTVAPFPHAPHRTGRADLSGSSAIAGFRPHRSGRHQYAAG